MEQYSTSFTVLAIALTLLLALGVRPCEADIFASPENYHECLLERLPDVQNDVVAASENSQCRVAFPDSTPPEKVDPGWFGPETVAECLAEFGTNTPSSYAANLIREACFQLYPEQPAE